MSPPNYRVRRCAFSIYCSNPERSHIRRAEIDKELEKARNLSAWFPLITRDSTAQRFSNGMRTGLVLRVPS